MDKDRGKIDGKSIARMFRNDDEDETSNRWKRSKVDTKSTGERSKISTESMADLLSDDEDEPLAPPQLLSPSQSSLFELSGTELLHTAPSTSIQPSTMTPTQLLPLPQSSFCESSGTELLPTTASSSTQPPTMMTIQPPTTQLSEDGMASKIGVKECLDEVAKDMAYRILDEECDAFVRDVTTLPPPLPAQSSFLESSGTELLPTTSSSSTQPPTMMTIQPPTTQLSEEENMDTLLKNLAYQTVKEDGMASKIGVKECLDEVTKDLAYRILDEECDAFVRDVTTLPPSTQPLELSDDEKPNMENIAKKG